MDRHLVGKAKCLTAKQFRTKRWGCEILAGVVRVGDQNKIVALRLSGAQQGKVVQPDMRPSQLDEDPAFNAWPMASFEESKKIIAGELPTQCGFSLGSMLVQDFFYSI